MKITLELYGLPSQTSEAEFMRREEDVAIVRGYLGDETRYRLTDGKQLDTTWDFWRICARDRREIKAMVAVA